jgi:hypothetical protein
VGHKRIVLDTVGSIVDRHDYWTQCRRCGREAKVDLRAVIAAKGPDYQLDRLNQALRCGGCGARGWPKHISVRMVWTGGLPNTGWLQGLAGKEWSRPAEDTTHRRRRWRGKR